MRGTTAESFDQKRRRPNSTCIGFGRRAERDTVSDLRVVSDAFASITGAYSERRESLSEDWRRSSVLVPLA